MRLGEFPAPQRSSDGTRAHLAGEGADFALCQIVGEVLLWSVRAQSTGIYLQLIDFTHHSSVQHAVALCPPLWAADQHSGLCNPPPQTLSARTSGQREHCCATYIRCCACAGGPT